MRPGIQRLTVIAVAIGWAAMQPVAAQVKNDPEFRHPCRGQPWWVEDEMTFEEFSFWVGEWQVTDTASGELRGFDDVELIMEGCVIRQHWRQLDDGFTQPGLPWRLNGTSLTGITWDGKWRQLWTDNNGGNMLLTGGVDEEGRMVLVSEWQGRPRPDGTIAMVRFFWYWLPGDDGTIHNWGEFQRTDEHQDRVKYFDITYRPNAVGWPAARMRDPAVEEQN